ncbi:AraC family transcriptional regulator [Paenochrobactrum sp. BZR 588]|uniref:AraC family transcriptional regulator n=1 Tax=unclassified Paenochrobactrum TaxID=2639760 RepID=UPI003851A4F5
MAWLKQEDAFDADSIGNSVIGIAADMGSHDSGWHHHKMGQFLFTQGGCITIHLPDRLCLLPPTRLAWLPPDIPHRAIMTEAVDYRSVYIDVSLYSNLPAQVEVMTVTPLLRAVLERIAVADFNTDWSKGAKANILAVCLDEVDAAQREPMLLPLPSDRRLSGLDIEQLPPPLQKLAQQAGASEKTILRIFRKETGMTYQQWRQQWRLLKAIELLASGETITSVAFELEFASDSAFIAFFKKMTGYTPRIFMRF